MCGLLNSLWILHLLVARLVFSHTRVIGQSLSWTSQWQSLDFHISPTIFLSPPVKLRLCYLSFHLGPCPLRTFFCQTPPPSFPFQSKLTWFSLFKVQINPYLPSDFPKKIECCSLLWLLMIAVMVVFWRYVCMCIFIHSLSGSNPLNKTLPIQSPFNVTTKGTEKTVPNQGLVRLGHGCLRLLAGAPTSSSVISWCCNYDQFY